MGADGEVGENSEGTGQLSSHSPQTTPCCGPHPSFQLGPLCHREHLEVSSLGPESSPPTTPSPLFHPQLQQTEAELRKVDEAIALFQKML